MCIIWGLVGVMVGGSMFNGRNMHITGQSFCLDLFAWLLGWR